MPAHVARWGPVLLFTVLALAATWPLAASLATSLPGDLGDPLFVTWVMAWVARHLTAAIGGDLGALTAVWQAPIFAPEPNTLAYSEAFFGPAAQALPVYWLTNNPLLAYNLVFLSTFVLSGLGAHVLVVELTGSRVAGVVAGLLFTVNVYRAVSLSHLHSLSSHWMPWVLAAVLVFARTGSRPVLAGGTLAALALTTSSGYYMVYCGPPMAIFAVLALWHEPAWRMRRGWMALGVAAAIAVSVQALLVLPYLDLRAATGFARRRWEIEQHAYDLGVYRALLPRLAPMLLLAAAAVVGAAPGPRPRGWVTIVLVATAGLGLWMSLGPVPKLDGAQVALPAVYDWFLTWVPGADGLRVVSRAAVLFIFGLSILAGLGAAGLQRRFGAAGAGVALAAAAAHLALQWMGPIPLDTALAGQGVGPPPAYLRPSTTTPTIYGALARVAADATVVELPFGDPGYELRYMFFNLGHGRPLLNGYSGVFPLSYMARARVLRDPPADPEAAWSALAPATHVVVHTGAWNDSRRETIGEWLHAHGAELITAHEGAMLWRLPAPPRPHAEELRP